jgi:hypothetical protein
MASSGPKMCSAMRLLTLLLLPMLCSSVEGAYFYNRDASSNTNKFSRTPGHYSSGVSTQHHTSHHKHHHGNSNGRFHQAAVGIISSGRLVPYTAGTITTTTTRSSKLSPLDRLINRLDSEGTKSQSNAQTYGTRFDQGSSRRESYFGTSLRRDHVSPSMLRSSAADRRYGQVRSHIEDSYEDDVEDDEDEDNIGDEEEDEDEDDEDADDETLNRGRHQHPLRSHKSRYSGDNVTWVSEATVLFLS